ncbi:anaerobic C4-dicarboxylate transporter [Franconibacter helveticus 513]|uniref:anaerobic C4-dicarboxylate transporter n=1 Tax=Franconibacter helveticus TaxID=357240 RepID=UPI00040A54A4|nr:anaerobic C4-dicarboxylate transporter [Franconibacter helveticus]MDU6923590.1 anaerobic C4-dicarboxylate transporter [Franconibacter helveticus]
MITIEFIVIILCLLVGTRFGGMGLGLISGVGLFVLTFVFGLEPGKPPVDVMLTILAVIGCAATLQTAGGLNVMMQFAEKLLRRHPQHITLLAPFTTWTLTFLCGTGHVVYTMFPIIADIALKKHIRPERPMAVASIASQMAITASPVSVAVVSLVSIIGAHHGVGQAWGILEILAVSVPASLFGVLIAALWSLRRGKDLADDPAFQARLSDPKQRDYIYGASETLMDQRFPREAYWSTWIFFTGILVVVVLGALPALRPAFEVKGALKPLSMNLVIQMMMLIAGAVMLIACKVNASAISSGAVFKAGMVAIFSVFGVAWMSDTFFQAHLEGLKTALQGVVQSHPWTYALVLFLVSKLVNSQAAALTAVAPMGLMLGVEPKMLVAFFPASYGYFILPTYPSDLACIGFDRSGTTRIGKFILNHSFILPGLIGVSCACAASYTLVRLFF